MWQVAPQITRRIPKGLGAVAAFDAGMVHISSSCARIQDVERLFFRRFYLTEFCSHPSEHSKHASGSIEGRQR